MSKVFFLLISRYRGIFCLLFVLCVDHEWGPWLYFKFVKMITPPPYEILFFKHQELQIGSTEDFFAALLKFLCASPHFPFFWNFPRPSLDGNNNYGCISFSLPNELTTCTEMHRYSSLTIAVANFGHFKWLHVSLCLSCSVVEIVCPWSAFCCFDSNWKECLQLCANRKWFQT